MGDKIHKIHPPYRPYFLTLLTNAQNMPFADRPCLLWTQASMLFVDNIQRTPVSSHDGRIACPRVWGGTKFAQKRLLLEYRELSCYFNSLNNTIENDGKMLLIRDDRHVQLDKIRSRTEDRRVSKIHTGAEPLCEGSGRRFFSPSAINFSHTYYKINDCRQRMVTKTMR